MAMPHDPSYWDIIRFIPCTHDARDPDTYEAVVKALAWAFDIPCDIANNILSQSYEKSGMTLYAALSYDELRRGVRLRMQRTWDRIQILRSAKQTGMMAHITDRIHHNAVVTDDIVRFVNNLYQTQCLGEPIHEEDAQALAMMHVFEKFDKRRMRSVSYEKIVEQYKSCLEECRKKNREKAIAQIALHLSKQLKIPADSLQNIASALISNCRRNGDTAKLYRCTLRLTLAVEFIQSLKLKDTAKHLSALNLKTETFKE